MTMWVNIYPPEPDGRSLAYYYHSREMADRCAGDDRIACIEVEL